MVRDRECAGRVALDIREFGEGPQKVYVSYSGLECVSCPLRRTLPNFQNPIKGFLARQVNAEGNRIIDRFCQRQDQFKTRAVDLP